MTNSYQLHINTNECCQRFQAIYSEAQKWLDNEVIKDCGPYVPMDTGYLMKSGTTGTKLGSGEVKYNAPYARAMYYGTWYDFSKAKHPQACAQWFEKAKAAKLKSWTEGVEKMMKKG